MAGAKTPTYEIPFRRRKEGKTNYGKRLVLVKSGKPRMVVRKTNKGMIVQFVSFDPKGDKTILLIDGKYLNKKYGWNSKRNTATAYLLGFAAGKLAKEKKVDGFVFDTGLQTASKGSIIYAALKGAVDAGLKTSFDEKMVPMDKLEKAEGLEDAKKKITG